MDSSRNLPNWIQAYLAYTNDQESPEEFHIWVALSNIAGALRRRVWFDMGYFKVYPNLYIVLVAPPGKCKKSTSMRLGRDILTQIPGLQFSPDSTSRERLIQDLAGALHEGQSAMTGHSSEFASFLQTSAEGMVGFLTDIFDCPAEWQHRTKSTGVNKIKAPFFNLLACTTPDDLARNMSVNAVGIGLTSRVVFVFSATPRVRDPIPKLDENQKALVQLLTEDLNAISQLSGEYKFDGTDTERFYADWYRKRLGNPNTSGDPRLAGYYERKHVHWIKVAMCIAASMGDELVLTREHMDLALEALELVEPNMKHVFAGVGRNPLMADANSLWADILTKPEGVTKAEIVDHMFYACSMDQIEEVLTMMVMTGKVRFDTKSNPPRYFPNLEAMAHGNDRVPDPGDANERHSGESSDAGGSGPGTDK